MIILGRFRNIIFHLLESVLWGNLITLQGIHNTDDAIAFSIYLYLMNKMRGNLI